MPFDKLRAVSLPNGKAARDGPSEAYWVVRRNECPSKPTPQMGRFERPVGGVMGADLNLITKTWHALRPALAEEKCSTCECLQGALAELKMDLEDLSAGGEQTDILGVIAAALRRGDSHACLGCEPCNPGKILADFYREQQAQATPAQPCCDAG